MDKRTLFRNLQIGNRGIYEIKFQISTKIIANKTWVTAKGMLKKSSVFFGTTKVVLL
jgi:hypothetical protein|tara:strand:+ start:26171 stop:26341 length:171 start_codon:yes stop_codon:yes gene_type:complete